MNFKMALPTHSRTKLLEQIRQSSDHLIFSDLMVDLPPYSKEKLIERIKQEALMFGDFTLKSGKKSKFYIDMRRLTLSESVYLVVLGIAQVLREQGEYWDAIGGPTSGADPIIGAALGMAAMGVQLWDAQPTAHPQIKGFFVRSKPKDHGTEKLMEGPPMAVRDGVIVEDVTTSGGSIIHAALEAEKNGVNVRRLVTVLDRDQGAAEAIAKVERPNGEIGYRFSSLVTIHDLGIDHLMEGN